MSEEPKVPPCSEPTGSFRNAGAAARLDPSEPQTGQASDEAVEQEPDPAPEHHAERGLEPGAGVELRHLDLQRELVAALLGERPVATARGHDEPVGCLPDRAVDLIDGPVEQPG